MDEVAYINSITDVSMKGAVFIQTSAGALYAKISNASNYSNALIDTTNITLTNWNNYRIELDLGTDAKFYINGTLVATLSTYLPVGSQSFGVGFGRDNTALFTVSAPTLSLEMNP